MQSRRVTVTIKRVMVCAKRLRDDCKQRLELNSGSNFHQSVAQALFVKSASEIRDFKKLSCL